MTFDEYKKEREWKRVRESVSLGYQCVASVKHFADLVHGHTLWSFSWSAIKCWMNGSWFKGLPYARVDYLKGRIPNRGDIVFFSVTKDNPHWHVAIAGTCTSDTLRVIEQNAETGNWSGVWWDAISIRNYTYYKAKVGNVLWWYTPLYLV